MRNISNSFLAASIRPGNQVFGSEPDLGRDAKPELSYLTRVAVSTELQ